MAKTNESFCTSGDLQKVETEFQESARRLSSEMQTMLTLIQRQDQALGDLRNEIQKLRGELRKTSTSNYRG